MEKETTTTLTKVEDIPCCPEFDKCPPCDVLDMRRRLSFPTAVRTESGQPVTVEVILHTRFSRCSGPLALGDIVYTTTLLPGERVRLATTDRRSRFSFDSESNLSYRSEQMSEEQYRMSSLRAFMSDQNSTDNGSSRSTDKGSWDFHSDASGSIGFMSASADANARGTHNAKSTFKYCNSIPRMLPWLITRLSKRHAKPTRSLWVKSPRASTKKASRKITLKRPRASLPIPTNATRLRFSFTASTRLRRSSSSWFQSSAA